MMPPARWPDLYPSRPLTPVHPLTSSMHPACLSSRPPTPGRPRVCGEVSDIQSIDTRCSFGNLAVGQKSNFLHSATARLHVWQIKATRRHTCALISEVWRHALNRPVLNEGQQNLKLYLYICINLWCVNPKKSNIFTFLKKITKTESISYFFCVALSVIFYHMKLWSNVSPGGSTPVIAAFGRSQNISQNHQKGFGILNSTACRTLAGIDIDTFWDQPVKLQGGGAVLCTPSCFTFCLKDKL